MATPPRRYFWFRLLAARVRLFLQLATGLPWLLPPPIVLAVARLRGKDFRVRIWAHPLCEKSPKKPDQLWADIFHICHKFMKECWSIGSEHLIFCSNSTSDYDSYPEELSQNMDNERGAEYWD
jgi:hypothetical protein